MMPVMMVRHLSKWQPALELVGQVEATAHSTMLLQTLKDTEDVREPEAAPVQWNQDLCTHVADEGVAKVVKPVVLVCVSGKRMLGPMVEGVDLVPQEGHHVQCTVCPVHAERHHIVIRHDTKSPLVERLHNSRSCRIVARDAVVETYVQGELAKHGQLVMEFNDFALLLLSTHEVFLGFQGMVLHSLCPVFWEGEEDCLQVGVVEASHQGFRAKELCELL
mmetsp:Transcript_3659/g.6459  ORF Transcript_3659/g.6459 Transcript_3659/m.6459 type:complete len:220 (+) Transcript_3659:404-1063(+)